MSRARGKRRHRAWRWRLRILVLAACALALAMPVSATAAPYTDLRSPDARDAAQAQSLLPTDLRSESATPTVVHTTDHGSQTLAIVLSSIALVIALVGMGVALGALFRRQRPRWTAG